MRRAPVPISPEDLPALVARYHAGETLHQLAAHVGCSPKHIRAALIEAGARMRPPGRPRSTPAQENAS